MAQFEWGCCIHTNSNDCFVWYFVIEAPTYCLQHTCITNSNTKLWNAYQACRTLTPPCCEFVLHAGKNSLFQCPPFLKWYQKIQKLHKVWWSTERYLKVYQLSRPVPTLFHGQNDFITQVVCSTFVSYQSNTSKKYDGLWSEHLVNKHGKFENFKAKRPRNSCRW